ncbi:hypothetical protein CHS0354_011212 [Potamilus streckersoni]|uniref:Farnesoic acid O-methyl transferase domain-containing protein n=1 Tax=Potamilus streckersoni TaxID=2493646 RepID=A0AAE0T274_9BIVA|nr:hypothetical protein CHS0354_011212 [Potamilus streckersoni]
MSAIRIAYQQNSRNITVNHTVQPLNCSEMNSFWIDWKDNVIQVGNGSDVDSNQFMYLNDSGNMKIRCLAISTQNYTGYWMFNASKCTVTENNTSQTGDNSTPDIQIAAQTTGNTVTSLTEEMITKTSHISITDAKTATETARNTVTSVPSTVNSINTHDIVPSTPTIETTAAIPANNSTCRCPCYLRVNRTEIEKEMQLKTAIELIRKELKMEKKNLSSTTRKKTSARDERVSAKTMGFTLGVCVLTTVFGTIILWDLKKELRPSKCADMTCMTFTIEKNLVTSSPLRIVISGSNLSTE